MTDTYHYNHYQLSNKLSLEVCKETREIVLTDRDNGNDLFLKNFEEAKMIADTIYEIIGLPINESVLSQEDFVEAQEESIKKQFREK